MKTNELLDIIGEANDEFIHDAKANQKQKVVRFPNWAKWSFSIAACLVLVIGICSFILPRIGGTSSNEGSAGDSGHENGSVFMSYAGEFQGARENWKETHQNPGTLNLQGFESWEGYQSLLSDGTATKFSYAKFD